MNETVRRFDRASSTYAGQAAMQAAMAESLMDLYKRENRPGRILEMGCGTGLLSQRLRKRFPASALWITDASPRMLAQAKLALESPGEEKDALLHFALLDAQKPRWTGLADGPPFDLIASNALVQWFPDLRAHFEGVASLLRRGGDVLVTGFLSENLGELRAALASLGINDRPRAGHDAEAVQAAIEDAGFRLKSWRGLDDRRPYADARALLKELSALGATGGPSSKPLTRPQWSNLIATYQRHYSRGSGVVATWSAWSAWLIKP